MIALCYHAVSKTWPAELSVTPENLSAQLEQLARRGYRGVTFSEMALGEVQGSCVAVTFDDGYRSNFRLARPILERFEMPGTLYVPTDYVGGGPMSWPGIDHWLGGEHEGELVPVSWEEARELADAGWEIGSHTKSHPRLTEISDEQLERELVDSRLTCERMLERPCRSIAYPYSDYDERVVAAAERAGYATGATVPERLLAPSHHAWPRIGVYYPDTPRVFRFKTSALFRGLRRTRVWSPLADAARGLLGRARRLAGRK